jgi:hypothetical protein
MRLQGDGVDSTQLLLPQVNDAANPTIAFGDDEGIYASTANELSFSINGSQVIKVSSSGIKTATGSSGELRDEQATTTNPTLLPDQSQASTGIGAGNKAVSIVAGGDEAWTFAEGAAGTSAGDSIAFVSDVVTDPTSNPTAGVYLYSDDDTLYIRD